MLAPRNVFLKKLLIDKMADFLVCCEEVMASFDSIRSHDFNLGHAAKVWVETRAVRAHGGLVLS